MRVDQLLLSLDILVAATWIRRRTTAAGETGVIFDGASALGLDRSVAAYRNRGSRGRWCGRRRLSHSRRASARQTGPHARPRFRRDRRRARPRFLVARVDLFILLLGVADMVYRPSGSCGPRDDGSARKEPDPGARQPSREPRRKRRTERNSGKSVCSVSSYTGLPSQARYPGLRYAGCHRVTSVLEPSVKCPSRNMRPQSWVRR